MNRSGLSRLWLAPLLFLAATTNAEQNWFEQPGVARWARGEYVYRQLSTGQENGHEEFILLVDHDNVRTLRATNAFIDRMEVWRHVVYRVDADFRPLDIYLNYNVDGRWRGSGFFVVGEETMDGLISGPGGIIRKTIPVPDRFSLIPHPIVTNSWPAWYLDRGKNDSQSVTLYAFDGQARDEDGMLGGFQQQMLTPAGRRSVRVPAGNFDCERFEFNDGDPSICVFGRDQLMVRMVWKLADVEYLLSSFSSGHAAN